MMSMVKDNFIHCYSIRYFKSPCKKWAQNIQKHFTYVIPSDCKLINTIFTTYFLNVYIYKNSYWILKKLIFLESVNLIYYHQQKKSLGLPADMWPTNIVNFI
jgi:hypothetical protein